MINKHFVSVSAEFEKNEDVGSLGGAGNDRGNREMTLGSNDSTNLTKKKSNK